MKRLTAIAVAVGIWATAGTAPGQVAEKRGMTLASAKQAIAAAAAEARRLQAPGGVVAVVDEGGNLVALERLDDTFAAGATIAIGKARTAALFRRPTRAFEELINKGRTAMAALGDFTPLQGGVPVVIEGQVVGGIGVSGAASAQQDEDLAVAGAGAVRPAVLRTGREAPPAVTHLDATRVAAAFARGAPLVEVDGYKVHASRRDQPGTAEVHDWETDVIYVVEGTATLVTGGTVVEPKVTAPGQVRGPVIQGGEARRLARGDVVVVPEGVPHWFSEVQPGFLYFVVKPISASGVGK
jgi:glc operon protein GlcG